MYRLTEGENTKRPGCLGQLLQQPKIKVSNILRLCGKPQFGSNREMTAVVAEIILMLPKKQIHSVAKYLADVRCQK